MRFMQYIIDGYNFFFKIIHDIHPLEETREEFIRALNGEIRIHRFSVTIIFDSHQAHADIFPSKATLDAIDVVFSPQNLTADCYILEYLGWQKSPGNFTIVTSDRPLAKKAKELGGKTLSVQGFLHLLTRKKKKEKGEKKQLIETDANFQRLLKAFEEKLNDPTNE